MITLPGDCRTYRHHTLSGLHDNFREDIGRYLNRSPEDQARGSNFRRRVAAVLTPELLCLLFHRIAHLLYVRGWRRLGVGVTHLNFGLHKANITPQSCIGAGCRIPHPAGVTFHGSAGRNLTLFSLAVCCPTEPVERHGDQTAPRLGDGVFVGAHAVLLGPITVGSNTKIAYSVRLDRDAPPGALVICKSLHLKHRHMLDAAGTRSA